MLDCKGLSVDEDLNETREKIIQLSNVVRFNWVDLDEVVNLLMSEKEELWNEELIEVKNESREGVGEEGAEDTDVVRMLTRKML